jgi:gliding motility-associated protein GldE
MNSLEPSSIAPLSEAIYAGISFSNTIISFIVLLLLLCLSALASGSESAFFSLGPNEKETLKHEDGKAAKTVLKLLENPKELLATLLISNNFVNVGIVILSSYILEDFKHILPENQTLRFVIEVIGITFMLLLIGEVIPKIYSTKNSLPIARAMALPIMTLKAVPPLSWLKELLLLGSRIINNKTRRKGIKITTDELEQALALTKEENTSDEEQKILEGIVKFGNTEACQIMKSRMDVTGIEEAATAEAVLQVILDSGYSRIPIYKESFDNVIGILYIKDLLPHLNESIEFNWNSLIRKPLFIPENKKIDDLLKEFQTKKMHMAIVVDEYGGASGLITLEDILEEIVGDIADEFDDEEIVYTKIDDQTYLFEGRTALVDFYKVLEIDGKEFDQQKRDSDTLGGFIVEQAGRILKNNEFIVFETFKLIVESSDKRRIKMVKIVLPNLTPEM